MRPVHVVRLNMQEFSEALSIVVIRVRLEYGVRAQVSADVPVASGKQKKPRF